MLSIRKRNGRWYVRGTIRIGRQTVRIAEHSAGTTQRAVAESYRARLQRETEEALLHGGSVERRHVTFAEAALKYLDGDVRHMSDISRLRQLERSFADCKLADIDAGEFERFCREQIPGAKASSRRRAKNTLAAIFRAAGMKLPEIKIGGKTRSIIAWLSLADADRLLLSYPKHVQPIALVACYCGLRASEALALKRSSLDLARKPFGAVIVKDPKNGRDRIVPLHKRVRDALDPLIEKRGPDDYLFLNRYGKPYTDTRKIGGNPLSASHKAACKAAGIHAFRWHDWRHHFATWSLRPSSEGGAGMDVETLRMIGGWSSLEQVQRYSHSNYERAADQLSRRI